MLLCACWLGCNSPFLPPIPPAVPSCLPTHARCPMLLAPTPPSPPLAAGVQRRAGQLRPACHGGGLPPAAPLAAAARCVGPLEGKGHTWQLPPGVRALCVLSEAAATHPSLRPEGSVQMAYPHSCAVQPLPIPRLLQLTTLPPTRCVRSQHAALWQRAGGGSGGAGAGGQPGGAPRGFLSPLRTSAEQL